MGGDLRDDGSIRNLFAQAIALSPAQRAALLADPALSFQTREELQELLAADRGSETFLENTVAHGHAAEPGLAERFGPFETRELLGRGGMGVVFKAVRVDGELSQTVAIKVVRHGWLDPRALDRFRNERQVLAGLTHSSIARLLDGGTRADGVAYLVMEYVDGMPVDRYCEEHEVTIPDRLRLFLPLCEAVDYAHRKLIVHRDLKPSNVLVTPSGELKLLDFGIAKTLDETGGFDTRTLALTPDFASPEQARGDEITTVTDIYGLGGLLYFLLTGRAPHTVPGRSAAEIQRVICGGPPQKPGDLRPELRGDIENILMKALHVDPSRRYHSARELADEIERYLSHRPVRATPDGPAYRARRFVQRHTVASVAAALAVLAVLGGTAASLYQAHRAQQRFSQVRALANRFVFDFEAAIRDTPGTLAARRMVASTAREYLADLSAGAGRDPGLNRELAEAYYRLSAVERAAGESGPAIADLKRSIDLLQALKDDCCGSPHQRARYISELTLLAADRFNASSAQEGHRLSQEALRAARVWFAQPNHDPQAATSLANALFSEGSMLQDLGELPEARPMLQEALRQSEENFRRNIQAEESRFLQAQAGYLLARAMDSLGDTVAALSAVRDSKRILGELLAVHPDNIRYTYREVYVIDYMGDFLETLAKQDPALLSQCTAAYREADALAAAAAQRNPGNRQILETACFAAMKLANHLDHQNRTEEAIPILRRSILASDELVRGDPSDRRNLYIQVSDQHLIAAYFVNLSRWRDATAELAKAEALMTAALLRSPGDLQLLRRQVSILTDQTRTERNLGHLKEARVKCQQALELAVRVIARQKDSKRPIGGTLSTLRDEAKNLGLRDITQPEQALR